MRFSIKITILFITLLSAPLICQAQKKVKITGEELEGGKLNGETYSRYSKNVVITREDTKIYCDEAIYFDKRQYLEGTGHVHIIEGDSIDITGERLIYDGNTRVAKLRKKVVFTKKGVMTLYTDNLDYDREKQLAFYYGGGKLVDSTNTLTSRKGYYNVQSDLASFKGNVIGKNDDFTLESDTLQYNSVSKRIFFRDRSVLTDKDGNIIEYEEGFYDTKSETSILRRNVVHTESYVITADIFNLEDKIEVYKASRNVRLVDAESDIVVTGESAIYWKKTGITKIFDHPILKVLMDLDTLYLTADTLIAVDSNVEAKKKLFAYHNVRFYKNDIQGKTDSLVYHVSDSMINFYVKPILWTEGNQISADSITAFIANRKIDRMELTSNSFVVSEDTLSNFNQIKGRDILAFFKDNKLNQVEVTGNGESLFYALNEDETDIIGVNRSESSTITIKFENSKAKTVTYRTNVDSRLIPPHELKRADRNLKNFKWRVNERPELPDILHITAVKKPADSVPKEQ